MDKCEISVIFGNPELISEPTIVLACPEMLQFMKYKVETYHVPRELLSQNLAFQ